MAWRFIAQRAGGDWLHWDLPISGAQVTRSLSAPGRLTGSIRADIADATAPDGHPLLDPWSTLVWAESGDRVLGGILVHRERPDAETVQIDVMGLAGYPDGQPWTADAESYIGYDTARIPVDAWRVLQMWPGGDLGVTVDQPTSTARAGTAASWTHEDGRSAAGDSWAKDAAPEGWTYTEAAPLDLSYWAVPDLGALIDQYAESTPYEYREETRWAGERSLEHRIRVGVPTLGVRRPNLRLVLRENVLAVPPVTEDGDDYASDVLIHGAGSGPTMVAASAGRPTHWIRRVVTVADKALVTHQSAAARARAEVAARVSREEIDSLTIRDHVNAPLTAFEVGDELLYLGADATERWVRVQDITYQPDSLAEAVLSVQIVRG